ncbi:uncharacterized protein N0V89_001339 [Didymosphaeria variabile]|uniref:J domain-containing protein n=1 Tax=Didymosphaeria variabile TaxID=1932322 RepID=A0A9W8XVY1_9PLEO|nr:uncharacterized protein N0V89_001339 [Didymosphaeria variabile]KAJ4360772.1 hypothetical protein N0V89_001339 [Didymosphaeria variabile]
MDPLPPDPYLALGLPKDVDSETIKKTYRKLVLKCHPDKVTDPSLKLLKQEEFHKIQQAYELIGEEEARARYDAEVKLESLRREKAARGASGSGPEVRTARYDVRTQAPAGASFKANGPARYEEHKSSRYSDDRYYEERSRKYDTYEAYPSKQSTTRSSREKVSPQKTTRETSDRARSDYKKSRDKEREKDRRHVASERERGDSDHSADEKARYEAEYKRRSDDARRRAEEDDARKAAADLRRKAEDRRSYEDSKYDRKQKLSEQASDAMRYIRMSSKGDERPSPGRTNSSRDVRDYYDSRDSRSRRERPETVRRSSARPRDRHSPTGRDRKGPEIVDWEPEDRKMPAFKHASSSPAEINVPRATPHRSHTESSRDHRRSETSPTPMFRRSETMPTVPQASSASRKASTAPRPSGLRESVTPQDSGASSPEAYPTVPSAAPTKRYYYPTPGGGVSLAPEDMGVGNGHRTVLREPERQRHRSPSPLTRPPMGANRPSETSSARYTTAAPSKSSVPPPPLGRSATTMNTNEDRGRRLYGEVGSDATRRENARRQTSFSPDKVSYSRKIGPEDVRWAPQSGSGRDRDREYTKPTLGRHATYVF